MKAHKKENYPLGTRIKYRILYALFYTLGLLPNWFLYHPLAWFLYVLFYRVIRYRVKVSRANLAIAFPEKTEAERRKIERKYYRWMAELFIDEVDMASLSKREAQRRFTLENEAAFRVEIAGKDFIAAMGHTAQWDYMSAFAINSPDREILGVFAPPTDKAFRLLAEHIRERLGMKLYPMASILRRILENRRDHMPMTIGLVADQTPPRREIDHWYTFFGRPTAFFSGTEKLARRFGMPIYFLHLEWLRPAHYKCRIELIWDGVEEVADWELTERYVRLIEAEIRRSPEHWLWSHRRWKHQPDNTPNRKDSPKNT